MAYRASTWNARDRSGHTKNNVINIHFRAFEPYSCVYKASTWQKKNEDNEIPLHTGEPLVSRLQADKLQVTIVAVQFCRAESLVSPKSTIEGFLGRGGPGSIVRMTGLQVGLWLLVPVYRVFGNLWREPGELMEAELQTPQGMLLPEHGHVHRRFHRNRHNMVVREGSGEFHGVDLEQVAVHVGICLVYPLEVLLQALLSSHGPLQRMAARVRSGLDCVTCCVTRACRVLAAFQGHCSTQATVGRLQTSPGIRRLVAFLVALWPGSCAAGVADAFVTLLLDYCVTFLPATLNLQVSGLQPGHFNLQHGDHVLGYEASQLQKHSDLVAVCNGSPAPVSLRETSNGSPNKRALDWSFQFGAKSHEMAGGNDHDAYGSDGVRGGHNDDADGNDGDDGAGGNDHDAYGSDGVRGGHIDDADGNDGAGGNDHDAGGNDSDGVRGGGGGGGDDDGACGNDGDDAGGNDHGAGGNDSDGVRGGGGDDDGACGNDGDDAGGDDHDAYGNDCAWWWCAWRWWWCVW